VLASEFRQREEERERVARAKMEELKALADELRAAIAARQQEAEAAGREGEGHREEVRRAQQSKQALIALIVSVFPDGCVQVEDVLSAESKRKMAKTEQEKKALSKKLAEAEKELEALKVTSEKRGDDRESERQRLEAARQEGSRAAAKEKEAALRSAVRERDEMQRSKDAYKKAWERAETELEDLRAERQKEKDERLRESEEMVKALRQELDEIRKRVDTSTHNQQHRLPDRRRAAFGIPATLQATPDRPHLSPARRSLQELTASSAGEESDVGADAERTRVKLREMRERRATLLGTGSYADDDVLVRLMDREISKLESEGLRHGGGGEKVTTESLAKKRKSDEM
jgi:myosin heavy subunit